VEYSLRDLYPAGAGLLVTDDPAARPLLGSERDSLELLGRDGTYRITLGAGPTWRQAIDVRGLRNSDVVASIFPPEGGQEPGTYISLGMRVLDAQGAPVLYDHVTVGDSKDDWFSPGYYYDPLAAPRTVTMIAGRPGNLVRATKIIHPRQAF
jgi:hypothetical protein